MRAIVITEPGGPEVLSWAEVPDPVPGPGEVVIDIAAAGVNRADLMQRQGFYPPPPGAPPYPGLECSGRIAALGDGVTGWQLGDEVCALLGGGGYAERVAVPQGQLLPVPDGVSLTGAAGLPEAACTIQGTVYQQAHLDAGEVYLVHGGAGGMGSFAIQLGKADGAVVACTAGTPDKLERCRELGADLVISYRDQDFVATILDFTDGRGADVILDVVGGPYLARNLAALATWGRLVVISVQGGAAGGAGPRPADAQAGHRLRRHAAGPAAGREGRGGGGGPAACLAAAQRGEDRPGHRPGAADGRCGAGAPAVRRGHARREDSAGQLGCQLANWPAGGPGTPAEAQD